jgi:glycosyltransferase involved in cell wall biosynthesis
MNFNPLVSIVIPVYNGGNYMREAIDSALAQTYANCEVIVVNDGSNDNGETEAIAKSYGNKIHYLKKKNGGVASALNLGIDKMAGDYFSWLSHDDVYYPNKIERQVEYLQSIEKKDVILYSDFDLIDSSSAILNKIIIPHYKPEQFLYELIQSSFLHGCTLLVPKVCFEKIGLFDETLKTTQDYHLWVKMAKQYNFIHLPESLIQGRTHAEQGSCQKNHFKEIDEFYIWFMNRISTKNIPDIYNIEPPIFFRKLALNYRSRGLQGAYRSANQLALKYSFEKGLFFYIKMLITITGVPLWINNTWKKFKPLIHLFSREAINHLHTPFQTKPNLQKKFTKVYKKNLFKGVTSRSGQGSDLIQTEVIRKELPELIKKFTINTFMDAPCGDFHWMKETDLNVNKYIGIDVVQHVIDHNNKRYTNPGRLFLCKDLTQDALPYADLIFCRDCLVHLSYYDAKRVLNNFKKSGSRYLLTTTFTGRKQNMDLNNGFWRTLNLNLHPFNFPEPILLINEKCSEYDGDYSDKSLGLWLLDSINLR